jgi:hypothetical protein
MGAALGTGATRGKVVEEAFEPLERRSLAAASCCFVSIACWACSRASLIGSALFDGEGTDLAVAVLPAVKYVVDGGGGGGDVAYDDDDAVDADLKCFENDEDDPEAEAAPAPAPALRPNEEGEDVDVE